MKRFIACACVSLGLAACGTTPNLQVKQQTPLQVAQNFCSSAQNTITDLKALSDLSTDDQILVGNVSLAVDGFCNNLGPNPDLVSINNSVTTVALKYISQSSIKNKDQYEIGLIVAQGAVTAFLNNVQVTQK